MSRFRAGRSTACRTRLRRRRLCADQPAAARALPGAKRLQGEELSHDLRGVRRLGTARQRNLCEPSRPHAQPSCERGLAPDAHVSMDLSYGYFYFFTQTDECYAITPAPANPVTASPLVWPTARRTCPTATTTRPRSMVGRIQSRPCEAAEGGAELPDDGHQRDDDGDQP